MFRKFGYRFLIIILLALIWWLMRRPEEDRDLSSVPAEIIVPSDEPDETPVLNQLKQKPVVSTSSQITVAKTETRRSPKKPSRVKKQPADDLKRISGIGPKISSALQEAGITTFSQLANMQPSDIRRILDEADIRLANPETWPEQARKEASGKQNPI